ncbi:MAG: permease [Anaerolineales bacterium]
MTSGHFGFAAIVKSSDPKVPLWALMFSTYLLDFIFIFLTAFGIESFAPLDPAHPAYGQVLIHAYYSHSLLGAAIIAVIAGLIARWAWGKKAGLIIGGIVFSHWLLDLIVHRPDLPILPGNLGNLPLLGFGLWQVPIAAALLELALALGGAYLYYRSARHAPAEAKDKRHIRALVASGVTGLLLVLLLAADYFNLSLLIAILLMLMLIVLSGWLDMRLDWSEAAS